MDWLMHNRIGDMYGPDFLVVYGGIIAVTLAFCWWWMQRADTTGELPPLPVPKDPDAYTIAFLRGGVNEVVRLAILELCQNGYLELIEEKSSLSTKQQKLAQKENYPDPQLLSPTARKIFDGFSLPRTAIEIFREVWVTATCRRALHNWETTAGEGRSCRLLPKLALRPGRRDC